MTRRSERTAARGVNRSKAGGALDMALVERHIEDLLQIPSEMIDGRKRKARLRLTVEKILQIVTPEICQFPCAEVFDEMDGDPVRIVVPRRCLPFAAIVREINLRNEFAETPDSLYLSFRFHLGDDPLTTARASDLVMSLTSPTTRLLRLWLSHHSTTHIGHVAS